MEEEITTCKKCSFMAYNGEYGIYYCYWTDEGILDANFSRETYRVCRATGRRKSCPFDKDPIMTFKLFKGI